MWDRRSKHRNPTTHADGGSVADRATDKRADYRPVTHASDADAACTIDRRANGQADIATHRADGERSGDA